MSVLVCLLMTGKHVASDYVVALAEDLGDCDVSVISWRPSDRDLPETIRHRVVGPLKARPKPNADPDPDRSGHVAVYPAEPLPEPIEPNPTPATATAEPSAVSRSGGGRIGPALQWRARRAWLKTRKLRDKPPFRQARRAVKGGLSTQFWRAVRADAEAMGRLRQADVVIALDNAGIRAGWNIARQSDGPLVVYGRAAGLQAVQRARAATAAAKSE